MLIYYLLTLFINNIFSHRLYYPFYLLCYYNIYIDEFNQTTYALKKTSSKKAKLYASLNESTQGSHNSTYMCISVI